MNKTSRTKTTRIRGKLAEPKPFVQPEADDAEFAALPASVRHEIKVWCARFARVWDARPITHALQKIARGSRVGYSTVTGLYYKLRRTGHWRSLVNRRKLSTGLRSVRVSLPPRGLRLAILSRSRGEIILQITPMPGKRVAVEARKV